MRTYLTIGIAMLTGSVIGGVAVQGLHAQAKPPTYLVGLIDVTSSEGYAKEYAPKAQSIIREAGGRLIATAGSGAPVEVTTLEGEPYKGRLIIQQWDSMDQIKAWHSSAAYQENRKIGNQHAKFRFMVLEGRPQ